MITKEYLLIPAVIKNIASFLLLSTCLKSKSNFNAVYLKQNCNNMLVLKTLNMKAIEE
jgi:hypothetical protein